MSIVLTCTCGHSWPVSEALGSQKDQVRCPVCGMQVEFPDGTRSEVQAPSYVEPARLPAFTGFQILDELGRGGMGIVYRAYDGKRRKQVALKTMQWVEPATLYRFKQEFRALAGLTHPNLVTLHELISDGRDWFFTMELVEGVPFLTYVRGAKTARRWMPTIPDEQPTLTDVVPASSLSFVQLDSLRSVLKQLVTGVMALHDAGKLHRDIKPGNCLVTKQGRVVLLDFGLAADLDRSGLHHSTEPRLLGTVAYMAPEQAASQPTSPASDWYAVGVMLYEALTGQLPFDGTPLDVLMNKQKYDVPPPCTVVSDIPEDLGALTVALLHRHPGARPDGRDILLRLGGSSDEVNATVSSPSASSSPAPLVGRKRHLDALEDAFHAAKEGNTVVVHVHGPSGVGKSTLIRFFLDRLADRGEAVLLEGRCYEQEAVPYKALDSLVDSLSRYLVRLPALEAEALMPRDVLALARVFPVLRRVSAVAQAPQRSFNLSDPHEVRRRATTALRELLGRLGDRRPLVLLIDDLQWGDVDSAALLNDLVRPPDSPALLLLFGYRSEDAESSPCLKAIRNAQSAPSNLPLDRRELAVQPLTPEEGRELVLNLLAARDEPQSAASSEVLAVADAVALECGGNPFFLQELVQHSSLGGAEGRGVKKGSKMVPLQEVLWKRIMRLPEDARHFLEVVAVAGRPVQAIAACQAAGLGSEELTVLAPLRANRLIRSAGLTERNEIETYHDRIRETILVHLAPATLRTHHRRLAQVLEQAGQTDPELLAIHFQGGGELLQAGKYYSLAAMQAAEALAFDRAAKLYRRALELQVAHGEEERTLRVRLGEALANAGRGAESAREYLTAVTGASSAEVLELQRCAALQFLVSGHVDEGLTTLREVLGNVGMALPGTPMRAFLSLVFRRLQLWLRGLGFRQTAADQIPAEELRRIDICWSAAAGLSMVDTIQGAYFHTRGLLLALSAGEPHRLARSLAMEAAHVSIGGSFSRARTDRILQLVETLARQVNRPYALALTSLIGGITAAFEGQWSQALRLCDEGEKIFRDSCTGVVWELDNAHRFALWALMFKGEIPEMARRLPLLLKEAHERDDLYAVTSLSLVVGTFVRLAADEPDRALRDVEQVMSRWSRQGFHVQHLNSLSDEVHIELYRSNSQLAWERLNNRWSAVQGSHFFRVQQVRVVMWHLRARCALAAARTAANPQFLLSVAEGDARLLQKETVPWATELSRLVRAGIALVRGADEAANLLRESAAGFENLEMPLPAAAARRLLGQMIGGEEGRTLVGNVDAWMTSRMIQNPARLAAMLAPG